MSRTASVGDGNLERLRDSNASRGRLLKADIWFCAVIRPRAPKCGRPTPTPAQRKPWEWGKRLGVHHRPRASRRPGNFSSQTRSFLRHPLASLKHPRQATGEPRSLPLRSPAPWGMWRPRLLLLWEEGGSRYPGFRATREDPGSRGSSPTLLVATQSMKPNPPLQAPHYANPIPSPFALQEWVRRNIASSGRALTHSAGLRSRPSAAAASLARARR